MNLSLLHKSAFVCGATQGIGKAIAIELARMGATITLLARDPERLRQTASELDHSQGQSHDWIAADFAEVRVLQSAVAAYLLKGKIIHILVNNTGGPSPGPILDASVEAFEKAYQMHLLANHLLAQALIPGMKAAGYGRIIQIISTSVREPLPNLGVSNTTRLAVAAWAKTLSSEVAPWGITVNNVLPGLTETERLNSLIRTMSTGSGKSEEEVSAGLKASVPLGRFARSEEIANVVAFLASPAASYVTGVSIPVDGGRTKAL